MAKKHQKEFFNKIPEGVPAFTLAGWDILSVDTISYWLRRARAAGVNASKIARCEADLQEMINFAVNNPDKMRVPD